MKKLALILGLLPGCALGQAVSYHASVTQTSGNVPVGASAPVMTTPNALVTVCAYPPVGTPCTNTVAVFQDQAMSNPFTQPLSADPKGRFDLWAPAGQYFVSVQTQSGVNVGGYPLTLGGSGGGGGGAPGGVPFNAQFQLNSTTFGGSAATLDAAGNSKTLSNDGLRNASLNQTSPGSNNGIQNSLQTPGNYVIAGPDYACPEGSFGAFPFVTYRFGTGIPAPFADATQLIDERGQCLTQGHYIYNGNMNGAGNGIWNVDRYVTNKQAQASGNGNFLWPFRTDFETSGSGKNGFEGGQPDNMGWSQSTFELMRRGIASLFVNEGQLYSLGDTQVTNNTFTVARGSTDASGEGFQTLRNQITQNVTPYIGTANANLAAGATLIGVTQTGNVPFIADGTYIIDATKGGSIFHITATTDPGSAGPASAGTWTVDSTLIPDTIGNTSVQIDTPKQYYGATTNESFTVTGLTHAICGGIQAWNGSTCVDTSGPAISATACIADGTDQESAKVVSAGAFSGGTQTITMALRYVHFANAYVSQGSHACNFVEGRANRGPGTPPGRQLFRIIGASGIHTMLYSRTVFGVWHLAPTGFFTTSVIAAAGTTLTRASNVVTVASTDPFKLFSGNAISVTGCSDATFNVTATISTDTGASVTYPNTGANGTTTCTNPIEIVSRMSALGVREAQEFPGAEIVNTNDPTTFALNGNITIEPNTNLLISAGDVMENHVYSDVIMAFDHNLMDFVTQNAPIGQSFHQDLISGEIPEGMTWSNIAFGDSPLHYQGLGGTKIIGNTLFEFGNNATPFRNIFDLVPSPANNFLSFAACLYGCADSRSKFNFVTIPTNGGFYSQTIHQDIGQMHTAVTDAGGNYSMDESTAAFNVVVDGGTPGRDIMVLQPGAFTNLVSSPVTGFTSHVIQLPASWSVDVPVLGPTTAPTGACTVNGGWVFTQDGHATFCNAGTWVVKI